MNIKLTDKEFDIVKTILTIYLPAETEVFAFGSRVKNTVKAFADLDIAIKYKHKISEQIMDKLNIAFENSLLPFKVDIIDLNNADEDFYNIIKADLTHLIKLA